MDERRSGMGRSRVHMIAAERPVDIRWTPDEVEALEAAYGGRIDQGSGRIDDPIYISDEE